jgi:hypothetical protein
MANVLDHTKAAMLKQLMDIVDSSFTENSLKVKKHRQKNRQKHRNSGRVSPAFSDADVDVMNKGYSDSDRISETASEPASESVQTDISINHELIVSSHPSDAAESSTTEESVHMNYTDTDTEIKIDNYLHIPEVDAEIHGENSLRVKDIAQLIQKLRNGKQKKKNKDRGNKIYHIKNVHIARAVIGGRDDADADADADAYAYADTAELKMTAQIPSASIGSPTGRKFTAKDKIQRNIARRTRILKRDEEKKRDDILSQMASQMQLQHQQSVALADRIEQLQTSLSGLIVHPSSSGLGNSSPPSPTSQSKKKNKRKVHIYKKSYSTHKVDRSVPAHERLYREGTQKLRRGRVCFEE